MFDGWGGRSSPTYLMMEMMPILACSASCVRGVDSSHAVLHGRGRGCRTVGGEVDKASAKGTEEWFRLRTEEGDFWGGCSTDSR